MTKKDYELIAKAISANVKYYRAEMQHRTRHNAYRLAMEDKFEAANDIAINLTVLLLEDNPKFDRDKFLKACGLSE